MLWNIRWANRSNSNQDWQVRAPGITDAFELPPSFVRNATVNLTGGIVIQVAVSTATKIAAVTLSYDAATRTWNLGSMTPNEFQIAQAGGVVTLRCLLEEQAFAGAGARYRAAEIVSLDVLTTYSVDVTMTQDTLNALTAGGYSLFGFKGVHTNAKDGAPLVWFQTAGYSLQNHLSWGEEYQAYTSFSEIIPGGSIQASAAYDITLGQVLEVDTGRGTGSVVDDGPPGAIAISNKTSSKTQFTCGISQANDVGGVPLTTPLCAFPLYGTGLDVMAPVERVLLMFSTQQADTGTVIYKAYSEGVLIDLTGDVTTRVLSFDINKGWIWDGGPWAQIVPASADLAPLPLEASPALSRRVLAAQQRAPQRLPAREAAPVRQGEPHANGSGIVTPDAE